MTISGEVTASLITALGALAVALLHSNWRQRKFILQLTKAQATNVEATTIEISDRLAREWLERLEKQLTELGERLTKEERLRRGAIAYIERLFDWITMKSISTHDLPPLPETLRNYLSDPLMDSDTERTPS